MQSTLVLRYSAARARYSVRGATCRAPHSDRYHAWHVCLRMNLLGIVPKSHGATKECSSPQHL
ncbi:protein of unknown function [Bradyrhizobium vignae]|uniref:Uncharacterized protein n=1 Tax=Bradyrhizobium vignae TaxID=1549949 RepID=A0A2U3Q3I0_9BRAD|nr:protein of unknown function [Bradyrhizobium vignae]